MYSEAVERVSPDIMWGRSREGEGSKGKAGRVSLDDPNELVRGSKGLPEEGVASRRLIGGVPSLMSRSRTSPREPSLSASRPNDSEDALGGVAGVLVMLVGLSFGA